MAEVRVTLYAVALLLVAAALVLWQWAVRRASRRATGRHLAQQIAATAPRTEPAFDIRAPTTPAGITVDPWRNSTDDALVTAPRLAWPDVPGWLEGVATSGQLALGILVVLLVALGTALAAGPVAAVIVFLLLLAIGAFAIWHRTQKMHALLVAQLPVFIDAIVRLITVGNAIHAAFQLAIPTTKAPLREYMEKASALVRAGVDLDQALAQMAARVRIEEMHLLASILGLGVRYGGRADVLLERVAHFMRDREQAQHELVAMSAETRLSAWILGLLPMGVGAAIVVINPAYFALMWNDDSGRSLLFGALALQATGVFLLYRLARLS